MKNKQPLSTFLSGACSFFEPPPAATELLQTDVAATATQRQLNELQQQYTQLDKNFKELTVSHNVQGTALKEVNDERFTLIQRVAELEKELANERKLRKNYQQRLSKYFKRAAGLHDVRRRDERRFERIKELKAEVKSLKGNVKSAVKSAQAEVKSAQAEVKCAQEEVELKEQSEAVDVKAQRKKVDKAKRMVRYYKEKAATSASTSQLKVKGLEEQLEAKEEHMAALEERVEDLVARECGKLGLSSTFVKGKYTDSIRSVYQDLMCLNVGRNNCDKIVRTVLKGIAGLEVERLPKTTFASEMIVEARTMAQLQICDTVLEEENLTLCSDGTTKYGHHYGSYDVSFGAGHIFTLGIRETADGTAVTTLEVLKEVVQDLVDLGGVDKDRLDLGHFLTKIKNVMSDRHTVQKKFNGLLADFRGKFLPAVTAQWDNMSLTQREQSQELNEFFCGMHFVVGLAEQASSTLKAWEHSVFGEKRVGALAVTGFAGKDEGGTERLVRTVCKSIQDRGCEKSGKALQFRAFLSSEHGVSHVPLAPFKGNRFNILFHNGAGVYHLYEHLQVFFQRHKSENEQMLAVAADLGVTHYIAGVKALGIVDKVITGPLWRAIEKEKHVLAMNERYERLRQCFVKWSSDSTDLLHGTDILYPDVPVKKDSVYDSLMKPCKFDGMVKQVLEMLCSSFKMLSERMLSDHLKGGKYSEVSADKHRELESVPTTNTTVERDFGMLDRLMREKPNASCIALEAMIMYKRNKTTQWSASLEESQRSAYLQLAQKSKAQQRKLYAERLATIKNARESKELSKKEAILKKANQDHVRKLTLGKEILAVGGLVESQSELDQKLSVMKSEKDKVKYLHTQLKYWKFILGAKNEGGVLNMSISGKSKTVEQLRTSLIAVINSDNKALEGATSSRQPKTIGSTPDTVVEVSNVKLHPPPAKKTKLTPVSNIKLPEQLVGKLVKHHMEDSGKMGWFNAVVIGMKGTKYFLRYDGYPDVYSFKVRKIEEDISNGDMEVRTLCPRDLLNKDIRHLWLVEDDEVWCKGVIVSFSKDEGNDTMFELTYECEDPDDESEDEVFECKLLQDYLQHELRFT